MRVRCTRCWNQYNDMRQEFACPHAFLTNLPVYGRSPAMLALPKLRKDNEEKRKELMNDNTDAPMGKRHDGLPVHGYKPQSEANVQLVNKLKEAEENVLRMLDALGSNPDTDKRWLALGRTHIEQGFMAANRSVFRPSRLALPGDTPGGNPGPMIPKAKC